MGINEGREAPRLSQDERRGKVVALLLAGLNPYQIGDMLSVSEITIRRDRDLAIKLGELDPARLPEWTERRDGSMYPTHRKPVQPPPDAHIHLNGAGWSDASAIAKARAQSERNGEAFDASKVELPSEQDRTAKKYGDLPSYLHDLARRQEEIERRAKDRSTEDLRRLRSLLRPVPLPRESVGQTLVKALRFLIPEGQRRKLGIATVFPLWESNALTGPLGYRVVAHPPTPEQESRDWVEAYEPEPGVLARARSFSFEPCDPVSYDAGEVDPHKALERILS